jgi:hypothetical protein
MAIAKKKHGLNDIALKAGIPLGKAVDTLQRGFFKADADCSNLVISDGLNRKSKITCNDSAVSKLFLCAIDKVL